MTGTHHPVERVHEVMAAYRAGEPTKLLAHRYSVGMRTLWRWLDRLDVPRRGQPNAVDRDRVRELHAAGLTDGQIAGRLGHSSDAIYRTRLTLELPANHPPHFALRNRHGQPWRRADLGRLRALHAEGLRDDAIGERMGLAMSTIERWRQRLQLPANRKKFFAEVEPYEVGKW